MKKIIIAAFLLCANAILAQTTKYAISFNNAVHHEAEVKIEITDVKTDTLKIRMARSSPGRYAIHEFAKNVYNVKATNEKGAELNITRPNPYEWFITGHTGNVTISYTLYANRADGTYSQIDETHAHLNIPATFMYVPAFSESKIEVTFVPRVDLNWKIATQLPSQNGTTYYAPNLQYFMDSPTEISNFKWREFNVDGKTIALALHDNGTEAEADTYFEKVKKVVLAEKDVFGTLPEYDYDHYTFLACYGLNASGDGMEHRNSTILTNTKSLANGGMDGNIGTVAHEFFHGWNVERIRPTELEPFDFTQANMTGSLWFAEGFTSYYTNFTLCRAGLITPQAYVEGLTSTFNYVWTSPARQFFNPIEMSYQAPFVDAATAVDPVNKENTFISYYSYGSILGLALDLSLRQNKLNLDDYMKLVWKKYGQNEAPYTITNLHNTLNEYAGENFGDDFFNSFIYQSKMPDYKLLFKSVGIALTQDEKATYFGAYVNLNGDGNGVLSGNSILGSPAYIAGLAEGDVITAINGNPYPKDKKFSAFINEFNVGAVLKVDFLRNGVPRKTSVTLTQNPGYSIYLAEKEGEKLSRKVLKQRKEWLKN